MGFIQYIRQDKAANKDNTKGKLITLLFRTAAYISKRKGTKLLFFPYLLFYRFFVEWVLGVELPWQVQAGEGLTIYHGQGMVANKLVRFGKGCTLRQSTTIGNAKADGDCPLIGDNVDIGANVCIIGPITIGDNVSIGAGSVLVKDVPSDTIVVGNPAKVIRYKTQLSA